MKMTPEFITRFLDNLFGGKILGLYINDEESIYSDYRLFLFADDSNFTPDDASTLDDEDDFEGHYYYMSSGASKMCIIFDDFDDVIKIPFDGIFQWEKGSPIVYQYYCDHLRLENAYYDEASPALRKILLKNEYVGKFGGLSVYTQKKIYQSFNEKYDGTPRMSREISQEVQEVINESRKKNKNKEELPHKFFLADIAEAYPDDCSQIIREMDFTDLHEGNLGYLEDGSPVIFDYAGFDE